MRPPWEVEKQFIGWQGAHQIEPIKYVTCMLVGGVIVVLSRNFFWISSSPNHMLIKTPANLGHT